MGPSRFFGRSRRRRGGPPYNVLVVERVRCGSVEYDLVAVRLRWYLSVAVYESWSRRFVVSGHVGLPETCRLFRTNWVRVTMGFLDKSRPSKSGPVAFIAARDAWIAKEFPATHEFLTVGELPGGEVRQVSTLTIFTEGGLWKGCLSERDAEANLFASGDSLEAMLGNLEERLTAPHVDWRRKSGGGARGRQQRS